MERTDLYHQALKERVCGICLDRLDDGSCGLPAGRNCAVDLHLPQIVRAVEAVESDKISDYVDSIRNGVCAQCPNQTEAGYCHFRENFDCTLDTFVYLVVEAIEGVKARQATGFVMR